MKITDFHRNCNNHHTMGMTLASVKYVYFFVFYSLKFLSEFG